MAILLGCDSVELEFPTKHIFDDVTLGVNEGDRIGIVGRNGDGKSTLLSVLAGELEPDDGRVTHRRGVTVGLLGQKDALDDNATVHHAVVGDAPEYEWASSPRVRSVLDGLIADVEWEGKVGELSGGQRRRVDLARLLIGDYDVLMLDEPTNHLDIRTINWLAAHLKTRWAAGVGALLVVTHDRWFLDEVCTSMWEVHDGRVDPFEGGYSAYILQRVERDRLAAAAEDRRRNMARKELAWLSRGAQARSTKPKFRVEAARALIADVPPVRNELELKRLAVSRLGKQVIDVIDATAGYSDEETGAFRPVVSDATWLIGAGDRFGLLGENGAGKSTLLQVIQGKLAPVRGRVKIGATVRFGILSQQLDELAPYMDQTIREVLSHYKRLYIVDGKETSPEKLLERLGFTTQQLWSRIGDLSGGQRRRLSLLLTILDEPNVLILDEPGNDLDTDMLAIVEDLLDGWPGTLILVTHDRYLMERVTDSQYAIIDGRLRHVAGGVDEYLRLVAAAHDGTEGAARAGRTADAAASAAESSGAGPQPSGLSNAERQRLRREVSSLERKMESRRAKLEELEAALTQIDPTDYTALVAKQAEIDAERAEIDGLETAWLEASEQLEG
ncbi:ABC-F family ATP-binding cassette domain-containing protein [Collinsella tanakaei]|uniref:ABC-F family ATP-binding cassette domain-containing protein n=1 Tax=Collinsella tanakaei TaxID=626935 RepID=UPI00195B89ED|nr:ABC-F family ATP-binding cassette domain-containing protein [Collinsella tanakaei]MBM6868124.1 ABC-F family ATP-binding cassette domain-containing protein [Collinsella tanakaei]